MSVLKAEISLEIAKLNMLILGLNMSYASYASYPSYTAITTWYEFAA